MTRGPEWLLIAGFVFVAVALVIVATERETRREDVERDIQRTLQISRLENVRSEAHELLQKLTAETDLDEWSRHFEAWRRGVRDELSRGFSAADLAAFEKPFAPNLSELAALQSAADVCGRRLALELGRLERLLNQLRSLQREHGS